MSAASASSASGGGAVCGASYRDSAAAGSTDLCGGRGDAEAVLAASGGSVRGFDSVDASSLTSRRSVIINPRSRRGGA
jgi:hypothetical protein